MQAAASLCGFGIKSLVVLTADIESGATHLVAQKMLAVYAHVTYATLAKAVLVPLLANESITAITVPVLAVFFVFGALLNGISRSKPERLVMAPTRLVLAALCLVLTHH